MAVVARFDGVAWGRFDAFLNAVGAWVGCEVSSIEICENLRILDVGGAGVEDKIDRRLFVRQFVQGNVRRRIVRFDGRRWRSVGCTGRSNSG